MKVRNGFVSNSSSSSFVVIFPRKPNSSDEVKQWMFGNSEFMPCPYTYGDQPSSYSTNEIAQTVWKDILEQKPSSEEKALEEIRSGWFDGIPELPGFNLSEEEHDKAWENWERKCKAVSKEVLDRFLQKHEFDPNVNVLYVFEYCDNDGHYFTTLEHGDTFRNLPHIKTSKH